MDFTEVFLYNVRVKAGSHPYPKRRESVRMVYDLQKASMWKRISAFLFDFIMLCIVAVLMALILSWITGFDGYQQQYHEALDRVQEEYQVNFELSYAEYDALSDAEREQIERALDALRQDDAAMRAYQMVRVVGPQLILSLSILFAVLIMEFFIPLKLKDGRTLGKKIFGLAVMRTDGVRINTVSLLIRALLGKYTIEIMIPVLILLMVYWGVIGIIAPIILFLILIVEICVMCFTRTNSMIHDLLANTVVVDYMSQMIFDTYEDMIAYKERIAAEQALKEPY